MNGLADFRQTKNRAWMWFALIVMSVASSVFYLLVGAYPDFLMAIFIVCLVHWVNQIERELTRRNIKGERKEQ